MIILLLGIALTVFQPWMFMVTNMGCLWQVIVSGCQINWIALHVIIHTLMKQTVPKYFLKDVLLVIQKLNIQPLGYPMMKD